LIQCKQIRTPKELTPASIEDVKFDGETLYICANKSKWTTCYHMVALTYDDVRKHQDEIRTINNNILNDLKAFQRKGFLFKMT
jgi:hypothetical protein